MTISMNTLAQMVIPETPHIHKVMFIDQSQKRQFQVVVLTTLHSI